MRGKRESAEAVYYSIHLWQGLLTNSPRLGVEPPRSGCGYNARWHLQYVPLSENYYPATHNATTYHSAPLPPPVLGLASGLSNLWRVYCSAFLGLTFGVPDPGSFLWHITRPKQQQHLEPATDFVSP